MLIAAGDAVASEDNLAGTWSWVKVNDHACLYRTLVEEGFVYQLVTVNRKQCRYLKQLSEFFKKQILFVTPKCEFIVFQTNSACLVFVGYSDLYHAQQDLKE